MRLIAKWLRPLLHRLRYKRWLQKGYLANQKHAIVYKFKDTYQFVAEHQNENGYLYEDNKVLILPETIDGTEFIQNLKMILQNSGAVDTRSVVYDRTKFLRAHRAKSYRDFYSHSISLSVTYDVDNQTISILSWRPAPDRGLVPVEGSKQTLDANNEASWLQIKSILDEQITSL
ncbi:hypothetical protein [Prevotella sp. KH2C16]|uniref:hypothetical protein n=1 Tax=Prevotella sp. KH2C16 TaxID=1855325 RepID=UPI0008E47ED4|nr:hypothetical protein [Prevotella sp. KH2C16]SFG10992.1 hypothetical protein SAMN05216383_10593 [Prevotella sp. KH2C16]